MHEKLACLQCETMAACICYHFPCPTPMFLTTPKYVLKPSSSVSLSRCLFPSFSIFLLSNLPTATKLHPIRLSLYFKITSTQYQQCGTLHAIASAPLSPALPLFLHVAASRSRACWILLAPTHQLLTLPCPLESYPPFSATT